jgi:hypothetical protein
MNTYTNQGSGSDQVINELLNQCMCPFKSQRGFSRVEILNIFVECAQKALTKLKEIEKTFPETEPQDYFIFFDKIITDIVMNDHGIHCIEFWASVWKHNILLQPFDERVQEFFNNFIELMSRH